MKLFFEKFWGELVVSIEGSLRIEEKIIPSCNQVNHSSNLFYPGGYAMRG